MCVWKALIRVVVFLALDVFSKAVADVVAVALLNLFRSPFRRDSRTHTHTQTTFR